jgi:tRNA pseudouridine55 synthase
VNGLLNVLKPPGMTSHDVVGNVRRLTGSKVGHTGTLDPLAAGVLVLTVGAGTRLTHLLAQDDKCYRAEILIGVGTDTLDLEGEFTSRSSAAHLTADQVRDALEGLCGDLEIEPPMFSAVKQDGRRLYELARQGQSVERNLRAITVERFALIAFESGECARCMCDIHCSKGTYVRSLAKLLGDRLGLPACLGFLLRTQQGIHRLRESLTLEELADLAQAGCLAQALFPLERVLPPERVVRIAQHHADLLRAGRQVPFPHAPDTDELFLVLCGDIPVCLAQVMALPDGPVLQPRKVMST